MYLRNIECINRGDNDVSLSLQVFEHAVHIVHSASVTPNMSAAASPPQANDVFLPSRHVRKESWFTLLYPDPSNLPHPPHSRQLLFGATVVPCTGKSVAAAVRSPRLPVLKSRV